MKHFYKILLATLFTTWHLLSPAQAKFSTIVNEKEIGKNDYVQVEYIVENAESVEKITPPSFNGFKVVSGPSQLQGMTFVNGALSKYEGISFMLQPTTTGRLTIAGASAVVNGKIIKSNSVTVVVSNNPGSTSPNTGPSFNWSLPDLSRLQEEVSEDFILKPGESIASKIQNNLFARLEVNKTSCYEGQPIVATYKLYSRLKSESKVTKRPTLNGFSVYDMIPPGSGDTRVEKINGKLFNVHIIRKVQLYPLQPGVFELDPVELDNKVRFLRVNSKSGSMQQLLDDYSNGIDAGKMEDQEIVLSSKTVSITVNALPVKNRPAIFDGAVGKFTIQASVMPNTIAANETAKLQVQIKGEGNLPLINAPAINWPVGVEAEEPEVNEMTDKSIAPITGTKVFEYAFTPKQPGTLKIPSISWCYFDPADGSYKTIKTDSVILTVTEAVKSDIKAPVNKNNTAATPQTFNWFSLLWAVPVLLVIGLFFVFWKTNQKKKKQAIAASIAKQQEQQTTIITDPFTRARMAIYDGNSQLFYKEVGNTIWNTLSEKLSITSSQLNKPAVIDLLQKKNMSATSIQQFESVVHDCEMALYTPSHSEANMKRTLQNASLFIEQLHALA
jgi:BatD DUF11 like domain